MSGWSEEADDSPKRSWRVQLRIDRVLHQKKTAYQDLLLFENPRFGRVLAIDGIVQTTERDEFFYHEMLVHLPAFTHGSVKRALIIGGGDGGSLEELLKHRSVDHVTMVEIDQSVIDFSKEHLRAICREAFEDPRLDLVIADGVEWVARCRESFDLILIDSTDPVGPGEKLFTESFYADCAKLLMDGGLLVTQNAVPFMEPDGVMVPITALGRCFAATGCFRVAVPSFFGGDMLFTIAAHDGAALEIDEETLERRFADARMETSYYTPAMHTGAITLPPYLERLLPARAGE